MIYLIIILIALAGIFEAANDRLSSPDEFRGSLLERYRGPWLDHKLATSKNKYKGGDPAQGPAWGFGILSSSHAFVFLSDGWHFSQALYQSCYQLSLAILLEPLIPLKIHPTALIFGLLFLGKILQGGPFNLFYHKILN